MADPNKGDINQSVADYNPDRLQMDIPTQHQDGEALPLDKDLAARMPNNVLQGQSTSHNAQSTVSPTEHSRQRGNAYLNLDGKEAAEEPELEPIESMEEKKAQESSSSDEDDHRGLDADVRQNLQRLASVTQSYYSGTGRRSSLASQDAGLARKDTLYGVELGNEALDPQSPKFDLRKWVRMNMKLSDEQDVITKRAGVVFKDVNVSGSGSALNIQSNVGSMLAAPFRLAEVLRMWKTQPRRILRNFDGLMKSGELLIVLGRPGSGCSTLLKTLTGQMHGLSLDENSTVHYNGVLQKRMLKEFKGEIIYNQEVDKHFPHLTVGNTLEHAAALRMSQHRAWKNLSRQQAVEHVTQVIMTVFGLSHTYNTKVGNDFVRGVSGGERKRVSIAEMAVAGSLLASWDNSTRGLDSATALTFIKSMRLVADLLGSCHAVAVYQASQAIYDLFDKAVVLYEGREIFFGKADKAKEYFERMGWYCPPRQTTGDFLTSVTNPVERQAATGYEDRVPRTPDDFEKHWRNSPEYAELQREIQDYEQEYPVGNDSELAAMREYKKDLQANHVRPKSPYVVSVWMQIKLNTKRAAQLKWNDKASTFTPIIIDIIMSLIVGSIFYNTPDATIGFTSKGAVLFFAILLNALMTISEVTALYDQRPIVEKHKSYAFYHPATEAIAGIILDIPLKFITAAAFNVILYFLSGLRREPDQFFIFFLVSFTAIFVMAAVFRTTAAITQTISQAMALCGVLVLAIVIYTGFVVPVQYMGEWFAWIRWINPIFYAFEILIANEFHGREFTCSQFVPAYPTLTGDQFICSSRGAITGARTVSGDDYIETMYGYSYSNVWRNFGILLAFLFGFMLMYFIAVELNSETNSTAEVLIFRRGHVPKYMQDIAKEKASDEEMAESEKGPETGDSKDGQADVNAIPPQTDIFTWRDVTYDIEIKGEPRTLLDNVSGFVKPGTLTALMGTSGAGKTTLLDVLAQRTTMGVVTGSMFVNGAPLDDSFQRKTGYVQQQDLHLETSTVRESLRFSAMLRQPPSVSRQEKYDYVEDVIKMLNMEDFAEAVVGVPGEGLNVEQRKLLTIGVELAAKPKLLLFLDEPTSGLDSQSSWAICAFLRKLADNGQAVLCTIHQPSAILFQQFDRLLFLRKGGQTVYFGKVGEQSRTLLDYFERNGARKCDDSENPAEYMLEIVGDGQADWVSTWNQSSEAKEVQREIDRMHKEKGGQPSNDNDPTAHSEFAMPFAQQFWEVSYRVFQQYWRMPSYIFAKMVLSVASGIFIGFSFYAADSTIQGMQNVIYSLFMVTTIFSTLVQQVMPLFVTQRSLYEVRERPGKAYSWKAFLCANILVEIPYQIIAGLIIYASFYYPVVGIQSSERQGLVLLLCVVFMIYASTFAQMTIAALPDPLTAGAVGTLLFSMSLLFNGVMQSPTALPGFWIFMYRASPFTYWVASMAATMLHARQVECSQDELATFNPPPNLTCQQYLAPYLEQAPGYLINPDATSNCGYCSVAVADTFLDSVGIQWSERWRNFGLMWVYVFFNIGAAVMVYYIFRVLPIKKNSQTGKSKGKKEKETVNTRPVGDEIEEPQAAPAGSSLFQSGLQAGQEVTTQYLGRNQSRMKSNPGNAAVF